MFEDFENMSLEDQNQAIAYMDELFEAIAIGNGDYYYEEDGSISIE